jgi:transcriptional regulator with XRE-family HTH domain
MIGVELNMTYEGLPITALVTWARTRAGLSVEEALVKFKKIQAWEEGVSSPTYPQLEQLAEAFKVPIAVFFFQNRRRCQTLVALSGLCLQLSLIKYRVKFGCCFERQRHSS